jgi:hypothetical protein
MFVGVGEGCAVAPGVCCSPAGALTVNASKSKAIDTTVLTGFIDLLLKNVVVKPVKWCATK